MTDQNITNADGITQAPAADGGVQQIPAVAPVSAAADARDALLRAIGAEAQHVAANASGQAFPGQASPALEQLARAYALVTPVAGLRQFDLAPPNGSPIGDDYIVSVADMPKPVVTYHSVVREAESTVIAADEDPPQIPAVIPVAAVTPVSAAADARDALLRAISAEAQHVADKLPGQASRALEQLAHAYALVTADTTVTSNVAPTGRNAATLIVTPA